jgi:hypothetical protein
LWVGHFFCSGVSLRTAPRYSFQDQGCARRKEPIWATPLPLRFGLLLLATKAIFPEMQKAGLIKQLVRLKHVVMGVKLKHASHQTSSRRR